MPMRDHYRPPIFNHHSWEGFHGMWPAVIVQRLVPLLPGNFSAEPRAQLGTYYEINVCAFEDDESEVGRSSLGLGSNGTATALWAPPQPTLLVEADLADEYEYEVLVYDQSRCRTLVAAVELVSPANKDRPESRRAFVTKCAALVQQGVCVSIVDLVTIRRFNLYNELLAMMDRSDPAFSANPSRTYAVTCRAPKVGAHRLEVGQPLPTLPLWLTEDMAVSLELEASYEETCRVLRIA